MAIRGNLVPGEILAKAHQKQQVIQAALALSAFLIVVALASFMHWAKYVGLEKQVVKLDADFKRLSVIVAKVEEAERTAAAVRARLGVITDLLKGRTSYPVCMSDFVRTVPAGIRVKNMGTKGGAGTAMMLNIAAESRSNEDIATWVRNMEQTGKFEKVELGPVATAEAGETRSYNFTVTTTYTPKL